MDLVIIDELGYPPFSQAGGALLDRLTHDCLILETGNDNYRCKNSTNNRKKEKKTDKTTQT